MASEAILECLKEISRREFDRDIARNTFDETTRLLERAQRRLIDVAVAEMNAQGGNDGKA